MYNYLKTLAQTFELKTLERIFSATSHGKGAVDGIGGTAKRMVYSTMKSGNVQVLNADDFCQVVKEKNTNWVRSASDTTI